MNLENLSGVTQISDEGIKKHFRTIEPHRALFELVWNGFDAGATSVHVGIQNNPLGAPDLITVLDYGEGIDISNIKSNFGRFNDSEKKEDAAQHGLHGRGRLAFHRLCHKATWYTKSSTGEARIVVESNNIKNYVGSTISSAEQHPALQEVGKGTCVQLTAFHENIAEPEKLLDLFSTEFGWYLALHRDKRLSVNSREVRVPLHNIQVKSVVANGETFEVSVIQWEEKPSSEKSYVYLLGSAGRTVHKQLSSLNNKPNFFTSVYVQSAWADNFSPTSTLYNAGTNTLESETWRLLVKELNTVTREAYDEFLRRFVEKEINKYEEDGVFPAYEGLPPEYAAWRLQNTKSIVRSIYSADPTLFNSLNKKQKKVLVRLLDRLSVSNENDALFGVLSGVLDLDDESLAKLATQLKRTTLENIVSAIELLQRRQMAVDELRELMNYHHKDVRETPDLQKIIENNTWLFGNRYETLGAEEATFTRIAKSLRDSVPAIDRIDDADIDDQATINGANRQTDLFLARKIPSLDSLGRQIYKCVVIEIKRPSVALNVKHLRQLDDYAAIIRKHSEFSSELMHFDLILIGRKISSADTEIPSRMKGQIMKGDMGLVSDDDRMKRYVLNWYTLLDSFELANNFMLEKLRFQREIISEKTKQELVDGLQTHAA